MNSNKFMHPDFSSAIIVYKGKILLILRDNKPTIPNPHKWEFPGGGVEKKETPFQGVKRELAEEINVCPKYLEYLTSITFPNQVGHLYYGILTKNEFDQVRLGNEGEKLEFYGFEELDKLDLVEGLRTIVESYSNILKRLLNEDKTAIKKIPNKFIINHLF